MVIALAGRRIDAPNASQPRFPSQNVSRIRQRISDLFKLQQAGILVSSAACGADLIALEAAGNLGARRIIVLPYSRATFRRTSVVDRPGDWGDSYDEVMDEVENKNDLIVLGYSEDDSSAYSATNIAILEQAEKAAHEANLPLMAVVVWEGKSRGDGDFTEQFKQEAERRRIQVAEILSLV